MKVKTKRKREFLINNQKHLRKKQDSRSWSQTFFYYRNERIKSHYRDNTLTEKRTNNVYVKNHESDETKL